MLQKSIDYLWSKQSEDGSWKSEDFSVLKTGQALTPFVLFTLLDVSDEFKGREKNIRKALDFIHKHTNRDGFIGMSDKDIWEYPNYASSYALRCLVRSDVKEDQELASRIAIALAASQFTERYGFNESSPAYGGWGFGGVRKFGETGHMDLAHTRVVLQALSEANALGKVRRGKAKLLLSRMQNKADGGFFFSPVIHAANKGGISKNEKTKQFEFGSYASATCDGILSLLSVQENIDSEKMKKAKDWMTKHKDWAYPEGIARDHASMWGEAMFFYHLAMRAEVFQKLNMEEAWSDKVFQLLKTKQKQDGSFKNENPMMKENDPILATSLALHAMTQSYKTKHKKLALKL